MASRSNLCQVGQPVVHKAVDLRAKPLTREQRKVVNEIVHSNDHPSNFGPGHAQKLKKNPFYGPEDKTVEAVKALRKVGL